MTEELLNYFKGDELAATTWLNKYAKRDSEGNVVENTPSEMHRRMAKEFAKLEKFYDDNNLPFDQEKFSKHYSKRKPLTEDRIFELFDNFKYIIPAGSVMAGLGNEKPVSLSNCFVLPSPEDSYSSIMMTRLNQVELMKRRGGVGYDLSKLRPRNASVNNAAITSTGAASFMDVCSDVTNEVAQQGRRGALMISMNVNHPDIEEFIEKKQDLTKVTGANVSVQVTDEFMEAVENNETYLLRWPIDAIIIYDKTFELNHITNVIELPYNTLYPMAYTNSDYSSELKQGYMKKVRAKEIWDKIIHCTWNTAEPGVIFRDRMINFSPDGCYEKYRGVGTNPCGEIFMSGNESCRLIAINMLSFIDNPFTDKAKLNVNKVYDVTYDAMRLGDDLVDLENLAVRRIIDVVHDDEYATNVWMGILEKGEKGRRCGLEFTAMADMCAAVGYKFCTKEANNFIEKVCRLMMSAVLDCQTDMALERGTFPDYDVNVEANNEWYKFISQEYPERYVNMMLTGRRNISFTTAGPTGTISMLTKTSSGIEPVFMPYYVRRRKCLDPNDRVDYVDKMGIKFSEFVVVHPQLKEWAKNHHPDLVNDIEKDKVPEATWKKIYEESPWFGACAQDIDWQKRVEVQGIVQKYLITHSISSTVNLPNDVSEQEVSDIYMNAWTHGLKGITVYRDGCREGIMIKKEQKKEDDKFESYVSAPKRPKVLEADFYSTKVKGEVFYVMVGLYKNKPYEVFVYKPDENKSVKNHKGTITKIKKEVYTFESDEIKIENISQKLTTEELATALYSSMLMRTGANLKYIIKTAQKVDDNIASFTSAMVRILRKYVKEEIIEGEVCPDCGGKLIRENGCIHCIDCGWSRCG